jgi:aromatic ring-cleaving dioxygenase
MLLFSVCVFGQKCPVEGDYKGNTKAAKHHRLVDTYKNRSQVPKNYSPITFDYMSNMKCDNLTTWDTSIYLDCYVMEVREGSLESCNCHLDNKRDTHIYVIKDSDETNKANSIIVEATPRFRYILGSTNDLKEYVGKHVRVYGYLFRDDEHKGSSAVDNGKGNLWRSCVWEIHPVTKIEILK